MTDTGTEVTIPLRDKIEAEIAAAKAKGSTPELTTNEQSNLEHLANRFEVTRQTNPPKYQEERKRLENQIREAVAAGTLTHKQAAEVLKKLG